MNNKIHFYTIKEISLLLDREDEKLLYGQFLDNFYYVDTAELKYSLIAEEPFYDLNHQIFICILAATAEKLANDYHLQVPEWVNNDKYILTQIYYGFNTENKEFQEYLWKTTPIEYKKRNLIVGETMLERC